jgi:hypothetical protein
MVRSGDLEGADVTDTQQSAATARLDGEIRLRAALHDVEMGRKAVLCPADVQAVVDERDRLRQAIVDADGEATAESIRGDVAEAQRDEARDIARTLAARLFEPAWVGAPAYGSEEFQRRLTKSLGHPAPDWLTDDTTGHSDD